MDEKLARITARNFRSLADVTLELGPLSESLLPALQVTARAIR